MAAFCPNCGAARAAGAFCANCGAAYDPPTSSGSATQQLARAGMTVQNVNIGMFLGGLLGLIAGPAATWLLWPNDDGVKLLVTFFVAPIVGTVIGQRLALWVMAGGR